MSHHAPPTDVREAILEAADRLFEQFGYRKTTVEEIAQEAGIGKGSIYLHFKSKEELAFAWSRRLHESIRERSMVAAEAQPTPRLSVRAFLTSRVMLRHDKIRNHCRSMDGSLDFLKVGLNERREAMFRAEAASIAELIRDGVRRGAFRPEVDPDRTALAFVRATNGLLPNAFELQDPESVAVLGQSIDDVVDLLLDALEATPS